MAVPPHKAEAPREAEPNAQPQVPLPVLGELDGLLAEDLATDERRGQALRIVRREVRGYLDAVGVIVVALDREGKVLFANRRGCELLGCRTEHDILGLDWIETFIPERLRAATRDVLAAMWAGDSKRAASNENEVITLSGDERLVAWTNEVLRDDAGAVWAVVGSGVDVTERRQVERALERSEAQSRALIEALPDLVVLISPEGILQDVQPPRGQASLLDRSVVGRSVREAFPAEIAIQLQEELAKAVTLDEPRPFYLRTEDGGSVFEVRIAPVEGNGALGIFRDVTGQHRLEAEVLRATDEERRRFGRDLHDGLGSHLVGLGMLVRSLARDARTQAPALADELEDAAGLIRDGAEQARALAHGLNPVGIEGEGLASALARLAAETEARTGTQCTFGAPVRPPSIRAEVAVQLYRIAQEAVTNALRHADAAQIALELSVEGHAVVLTVQDDGRGPGRAVRQKGSGLGLQTMAYRAHAVGGVFELRARPEGGTVVSCRLPTTG